MNGVFVQPADARDFDDIYMRFTGDRGTVRRPRLSRKKLIMQVSMAGEITCSRHRLNLSRAEPPLP